MEDRCRQEIIDLHQFFEDWFNAVLPDTAQAFARFTDTVHPNFVIVSPGGVLTERDALLAGLRNEHNGRNNFKIWIEKFRLLHHEGNIAVATYEEWQQPADRATPTARLSTAFFREEPNAPNGVVWLHVHETWIEANREIT